MLIVMHEQTEKEKDCIIYIFPNYFFGNLQITEFYYCVMREREGKYFYAYVFKNASHQTKVGICLFGISYPDNIQL